MYNRVQTSQNAVCSTPFMRRLRQDKAGNTIMLVAGAIIPLMAMIGAGVDMSRSYLVKSRLQQACDAGALAGRKTMAGGSWDSDSATAAQNYFKNNFPTAAYATSNIVFTPTVDAEQNVSATANARLPMTVMTMFGNEYIDLSVTCKSKMEVANTDIMFILDTTGSMADCPDNSHCNSGSGSKIVALRAAIDAFYDVLGDATMSTSQVRYGFVPYSSDVNIGSTSLPGGILPPQYIVDSWSYQSRDANMNTPEYTATPGAPVVTVETYSGGTGISTSQCSDYGRNRYPSVGNNPETSGTAPSPTTSTSYSNNATSGNDWGWSGAADTSGTTKSCRRTKTAVTTTYTATGKYFFTNWVYQQSSINVSSYKTGSSVTLATGTTGTVNSNGVYTLAAFATASASGTETSYNWDGCIEDADTEANATFSPIPSTAFDMQIDLIPTNDDERWRPTFPAMIYDRASPASESSTSNNWQPTSANSYYTCPKRAQKLTVMTKAQVMNYVNAADFKAAGGTYHDVGMIWGARLISPTGLFASENAVAPNGKPIDRNIIFMTDGDMAPNASIYGLHGMEKLDRRVTGTMYGGTPDLETLHNRRFVALCDAARAKNIKVWVIAFGTALTPELSACTNDPTRAFVATTPEALRAKFENIASRIASLRLSQ
jgi:Flp pilus assembly protein TadG